MVSSTSAVERGAFSSNCSWVTSVTATEAFSRVRLLVEPVTTTVFMVVVSVWPVAAATPPPSVVVWPWGFGS